MIRAATRAAEVSGIMRRMTDPVPSLPWYRRPFARSPAGRKLRRRILLAVAVLTLPWSVQMLLGTDPRKLAAKLGFYQLPPDNVFQRCRRARDCTGPCAFGRPYCLRHGVDSDPADPLGGSCRCRSQQDEEVRRRPPPGCRDAALASDDGDQMEWKCVGGFDPPDGGDGGP